MILYFTGTGNSRYVAKRLQTLLDERLVSMNDLIKAGTPGRFSSERPYIIVSPTYAWQLPCTVREFIRHAEFSGSRSAYFVLTCGDGAGNAGRYAEKLCREKGIAFKGLAAIVMPENYIAMFSVPDEAEAAKIIAAAEPRIEETAALIKEGGDIPPKRCGIGGKIQSSIVNALFYSFCISARGFRATDACVGCGKCKRLCPLNNIEIVDGSPLWGKNCTHCMSCICACPSKAIEYKSTSQGKPRYYLDG